MQVVTNVDSNKAIEMKLGDYMKSKDYHCCATCQHFQIKKQQNYLKYYCSRLGFETKTHYKFDCWSPRADIEIKMNKL